MKRRSKLPLIFSLVLFCVIILLPPIIHGYIYPNLGDDTAANLQVFDRMINGDPQASQFILSYKIVGYPLIWLHHITNLSMDALFLWFSFVSLALIGITLYVILSRLLNKKAGWLALFIVLFCSQGIFFQFYYGQIFNAINMGIILPILLYFSVRYLTQGKFYQLFLALILSGLFGAFHNSGIYLPFVASFLTVSYMVYQIIKKKHLSGRVMALGGSIVFLSGVAYVSLVPNADVIALYVSHNMGWGLAVPITSWLMVLVSPTVLVLVGFSVMFLKDINKGLSEDGKILLFMLTGFAIVLAIVAFARLSFDPFRQALDLVTIIALMIAILVSGFQWNKKNQGSLILIALVIGFGLFHNLPTWFGYNSAISKADKEAISYVNSLDVKEYDTSPEVAYWIYNRFTKAQYSENATDIIITRNVPMTPRSDKTNKWYDGHGIEPYGYQYYTTFDDGKIVVKVYLEDLAR